MFLIDLETAPLEFEILLENTYHRYASQCSLVILALENLERQRAYALIDRQFALLTREFGPATHRDEDFYVILIAAELQTDLLKMKFWCKLKSKICVIIYPLTITAAIFHFNIF